MTLQMLEYFVALAEQGSFTEAANACFVSQPALSRAIISLEKEMDCALVDRENRKTVKLTPAGETLLIETMRVFKQIDVMKERVKMVERQTFRRIRMGYIAYGILRDFRQECAQALEVVQKNVLIESVYGSTSELRERVLSGELDCALVLGSTAYNMPGCRVIPFCASDYRIMIPRSHPLFGRESLNLEELSGSKFVFFDPAELPLLYAEYVDICHKAGFVPDVIGFGHKFGDVASLIQQYGAVSIVCTSADYVQTDDLKLLPIENDFIDEHQIVLALVTLQNPINPAVKRFADEIQKYAECSGHE